MHQQSLLPRSSSFPDHAASTHSSAVSRGRRSASTSGMTSQIDFLDEAFTQFSDLYSAIESRHDLAQAQGNIQKRFRIYARLDQCACRHVRERQRVKSSAKQKSLADQTMVADIIPFVELRMCTERLARAIGSMRLRGIKTILDARDWAYGVYCFALGHISNDPIITRNQHYLSRFLRLHDTLPDESSGTFSEIRHVSKILWLQIEPTLGDVALLYLVDTVHRWHERIEFLRADKGAVPYAVSNRHDSRPGMGRRTQSDYAVEGTIAGESTSPDSQCGIELKIPPRGWRLSREQDALPKPELHRPPRFDLPLRDRRVSRPEKASEASVLHVGEPADYAQEYSCSNSKGKASKAVLPEWKWPPPEDRSEDDVF